MSCLFK